MYPVSSHPSQRAFTLLELITVILVVSILILLTLPVIDQVKRRAEKTRCIGNLHGLWVATNSYLQDHRIWPQVAVTPGSDPSASATAWIEILKPYGLSQVNWICPTIQYNMHAPDLADHDNVRVDYTAFPYSKNPQDPFRYSTSPWFVENGDVHGNGNLLIFPDGHSIELVDFFHQVRGH